MISGIKMEELLESGHSGIYNVEMVTKYVVLQSLGIHLIHMGLIKKANQKNAAFVHIDIF